MIGHSSVVAVLQEFSSSRPDPAILHVRYQPARDVLTVLVGPQNRWISRRVEGMGSTAYLDQEDAIVRVEVRQASRRFQDGWLRQQVRNGARRRELGFA